LFRLFIYSLGLFSIMAKRADIISAATELVQKPSGTAAASFVSQLLYYAAGGIVQKAVIGNLVRKIAPQASPAIVNVASVILMSFGRRQIDNRIVKQVLDGGILTALLDLINPLAQKIESWIASGLGGVGISLQPQMG